MPNFAEIAHKKLSEIERPPLPPVGHYVWQVSKLASVEKSNDGKWEFVTFPVKGVEAQEDVDPDALQEFGGVKNVINSIRFIFDTEDASAFAKAEYNLRNFLERTLKCAQPEDNLAIAMNNAVNQRFLGDLVWRPDKQNTELFHANINKTAPLE